MSENRTRANGKRTAARGVLLALLAAAHLSQGALAASANVPFADVPPGAWYKANVSWAVERGVVTGYEDGTFRPDAKPTEAEFLAMLFRAAASAELREPAKGEAWFEPYYDAALESGYPVVPAKANSPVNRGDAARLIAASFGKTDASRVEAVKFVLEANISNGRTAATVAGFDIDGFLTRAEAVVFVGRVEAYRERLAAEEAAKDEKPPVVWGGTGGGSTGGGTGGESGDQRPDGPVRTEDDLPARTARLDAALDFLGVTKTETSQGVVASHPVHGGSGAVLSKTSEQSGAVQIMDDANSVVVESAHALLAYAGVGLDRTTMLDLIEQVQESGNNAALKIGGQLVTIVRDTNPGQLTIRFTIFE
ncbi:MAG TPA: S-layer homology domain-containing protein [Paenibacillus sp.]|nr:S-layer homology domain-containing protein [Paenibacillus sp.]